MKIVLTLLLLVPLNILATHPEIDYFLDSKKLKNISETQQRLIAHGFKKVFFTTEDNVKLCGLFLDQSKTKPVIGTIIYCAGFYPGDKEGMSSFYILIADQPYNFLLFDARGHHESEGSFLTYKNLAKYSTHEYLDIIAAIKFVNQYNQMNKINPDIIIHGICSGAYHTIKALDKMTQLSCPECSVVKGIIFDSGWFHIKDIVPTVIQAEATKQLKESWFSWFTKPLNYVMQTIYHFTFKKNYVSQEGIEEAIKRTAIPTWFIHCTQDPYVSINPIQKHVQQCKTEQFWWIHHDSHANYHMTNHKEYQEKLLHFLHNL